MPAPLFRLVCSPAAVAAAPDGWMTMLLDEGELALLPDAGGLEAITAAARSLDLVSVPLLVSADDDTVMSYAGSLPTVWIAPEFGEPARTWARKRGPMTLLVEAAGGVADEDRPRIERFVAILGRQAE